MSHLTQKNTTRSEYIKRINSIKTQILEEYEGTDRMHLKYPLFKKQFYAMYHHRIDDVVLQMTYLQTLLNNSVKEVVSESIEDPENYDFFLEEAGRRIRIFHRAVAVENQQDAQHSIPKINGCKASTLFRQKAS